MRIEVWKDGHRWTVQSSVQQQPSQALRKAAEALIERGLEGPWDVALTRSDGSIYKGCYFDGEDLYGCP